MNTNQFTKNSTIPLGFLSQQSVNHQTSKEAQIRNSSVYATMNAKSKKYNMLHIGMKDDVVSSLDMAVKNFFL